MSGEINKRIREIESKVAADKLANIAHDHLRKITPVDSGNARKKTTVSKDQVHADYAYAERLDKNWSPQTKGQGLIEPTLAAVQGYIDKI